MFINPSDASIYAAPQCIPTGILIASLDGTVSCVNISTGSSYWKLNLGGPIFANPIYDHDTKSIFIGCADCNLYAGKMNSLLAYIDIRVILFLLLCFFY